MRKIGEPAPPRGLGRFLFRLPIYLYRLNLGWLLGGWFLLLEHVGRKSGKRRRTVIEVAGHAPENGTYTVASGFGPRSDWYRNLLATPDVTIQVGRRRLSATAVPLSPDQGGEVMARYARQHPRAARQLSRFMGYQVDGSEADYRALGREIPFVRFEPRH